MPAAVKNRSERLSPVPHQDPERAKQPCAGREKRANDLVPQPIARKCGQRKSERGDTRDTKQPRRLRGWKKRCQVVHRRLVLGHALRGHRHTRMSLNPS